MGKMTWNPQSPYGRIGWRSVENPEVQVFTRVKSLLIFFNEGKQ